MPGNLYVGTELEHVTRALALPVIFSLTEQLVAGAFQDHSTGAALNTNQLTAKEDHQKRQPIVQLRSDARHPNLVEKPMDIEKRSGEFV
jgi:hypothetical protein